tara:strand:- start:351 stop:620 length:270 start_codon:yes stop_codon:yes gene_type:complete
MNRCEWTGTNSLMIEYHDKEWGKPVHDDIKLFEYLILDAFQAGLSWQTIINKRENFRKAFDDIIQTSLIINLFLKYIKLMKYNLNLSLI